MTLPANLAERVEHLDGDGMWRQVFRVARRLFSRLAQERPLVLVLDDAHWLDGSSTLLVEHLLPLVRDLPILICLPGRPEAGSPSMRLRDLAKRDYLDCYAEISLSPLSPAHGAQLIGSLVSLDGLSPRTQEMMLQKAEGNPFFLEELTLALIDAGTLRRDPKTGQWRETARLKQIDLPDTLQGVIMARIDRLDEDMRQVLKLASVIGRSFQYRVLRTLVAAQDGLDHHLDELQAIQLVVEGKRLPELEYLFKHALVQDAAYESILLKRRRELHCRVAECNEAIFADRLHEFFGLLAYHYTRAEEWDKAREYLLKAGDQAGRLAADDEALDHYGRAIAAYSTASTAPWPKAEYAALEHKMGEALFRRGREEHLHHLSRFPPPAPASDPIEFDRIQNSASTLSS